MRRQLTRKSKFRVQSWAVVSFVLAAILVSPILAVFSTALGDSNGLWSHLMTSVLPRYLSNTFLLMVGVGAVSLLLGVPTAWIVFRFNFPGRGMFEWMLLLPAAVPTYLVAYTYTDFLEYSGPVQSFLRDLFGWGNAKDYWFPEIRSLECASIVLGSVLYPYVYMMARTAFLLTPESLFSAATMAGRGLFTRVGLPLARPAIIAGLALVLMETISEFGAVEHFAIETITLGIFNVWLGMNSLTAAAQIASLSTLFILFLLLVEIIARSKRRFNNTTGNPSPLRAIRVTKLSGILCVMFCLLPVAIGFLLPVGVLLSFVLRGYSTGLEAGVVIASKNSIVLASVVGFLVMAVAGFMVLVGRYQGGRFLRGLTAISAMGYAFPGTILAIGVVTVSGAFNSFTVRIYEDVFNTTSTGVLLGGVGLVIFACCVRFLAIGYGAVTSGLDRLPPNMMNASRLLGRGLISSLCRVIVPQLWLPIIAGGLIVFVDVMKELPMTLLLRPFSYDTLATYVYQFAKDELLEEAALPALLIIVVGIIPVMLMSAAIRRLSRQI